jgi:ATPase subunit of ABC transporter with duplicated ATPase domains
MIQRYRTNGTALTPPSQVLLGPNGAGKSTLLHTLAGTHPLQGGKRILGRDAKLGVFTQDLAQYLPQDKSGLDYVMDVSFTFWLISCNDPLA